MELGTERARKIAEKLYDWMSRDLTSLDGEWVVDRHEFLPANVLCDYAGQQKFIDGMAKIIEAELTVQASNALLTKLKEGEKHGQ